MIKEQQTKNSNKKKAITQVCQQSVHLCWDIGAVEFAIPQRLNNWDPGKIDQKHGCVIISWKLHTETKWKLKRTKGTTGNKKKTFFFLYFYFFYFFIIFYYFFIFIIIIILE